ncbi:MAG TPA: NAD(+) synthase [Methanocella sp.]|nr:NAD(+) synthase [Methanocella sp.]
MMGTEKKRPGLAECLRFDPESARREIVSFIGSQVKRFSRDGALVGLSGGLDSSTVACVCVEALGKGRVMGLILPERDTASRNTEDAVRLAESLGIPHEIIDVSPILRDLGAYEIFRRK